MTTWWLTPDSEYLSSYSTTTAEYGTVIALFPKQFFANDSQQHIAWLECHFSWLFFQFSVGIFRREERVLVQSSRDW